MPDSEPTPSCSLTPEQVESLASLKSQLSHIFTDNPGCITVLEMSIDTGEAPPFQSYPYRLPVQLVQPIKDALDYVVKRSLNLVVVPGPALRYLSRNGLVQFEYALIIDVLMP